MKICSRCYGNKPLTEFSTDQRYRLGVTGWCKACRSDYEKGYRANTRQSAKPVITKKTCCVCHTEKAVNQFTRSASKSDGYASRCKECRAIEYQRLMAGGGSKGHALWASYRMRLDDFQKMLDEQSHRCAICEHELVRPVVDHCHTTGRVRGLLCFRCNNQLQALESHGFMERAERYLEHHRHKAGDQGFYITKNVAESRDRWKAIETTMRGL